MANPLYIPVPGGANPPQIAHESDRVDYNNTTNTNNNNNTTQSQHETTTQRPGPIPSPKLKQIFYTWWILHNSLPFLLSLGDLLDAIIPDPDDKQDQDPNKNPKAGIPLALIIFLIILKFIAHLSLFYYLFIKFRALRSRINAARQTTPPNANGQVVTSPRRRRILYGQRFTTAQEMETFFTTTKKGSATLLILSTIWLLAVGISTLAMVVLFMFMGSIGSVFVLASLIGGFSLLGHLGSVWIRSIKVLVSGWGGCSCCCAGRKRRLRSRSRSGRDDVEEGGGIGEDGERLLPLDVNGAQAGR